MATSSGFYPDVKIKNRKDIKMNKTEIINSIAQETGLKKKDAEAALNSFIKTVETALVSGDKVQVSGLGTFSVKTREERQGRNPKTKETITIPASKRPVFSASKTLKESVN